MPITEEHRYQIVCDMCMKWYKDAANPRAEDHMTLIYRAKMDQWMFFAKSAITAVGTPLQYLCFCPNCVDTLHNMIMGYK